MSRRTPFFINLFPAMNFCYEALQCRVVLNLTPLLRQLGKGVPDLSQLKSAVLSQAHQSVIAAVGASLASTTANLGGTYPSAIETIRGNLDSKHSDST